MVSKRIEMSQFKRTEPESFSPFEDIRIKKGKLGQGLIIMVLLLTGLGIYHCYDVYGELAEGEEKDYSEGI